MQAAVTPGLSRRFKQLKKWEQSRYNEVYACPCCRGRFRLAKAMDDGHVFEIAKVVDAGEMLFLHLGEKTLPRWQGFDFHILIHFACVLMRF